MVGVETAQQKLITAQSLLTSLEQSDRPDKDNLVRSAKALVDLRQKALGYEQEQAQKLAPALQAKPPAASPQSQEPAPASSLAEVAPPPLNLPSQPSTLL